MPSWSNWLPEVRADTSSKSALAPNATTPLAPLSTQPLADLAAVVLTLFSS